MIELVPEAAAPTAALAARQYPENIGQEQNLGGSVCGGVQWWSAPVIAERERALMDRYGITNQGLRRDRRAD